MTYTRKALLSAAATCLLPFATPAIAELGHPSGCNSCAPVEFPGDFGLRPRRRSCDRSVALGATPLAPETGRGRHPLALTVNGEDRGRADRAASRTCSFVVMRRPPDRGSADAGLGLRWRAIGPELTRTVTYAAAVCYVRFTSTSAVRFASRAARAGNGGVLFARLAKHGFVSGATIIMRR